MIPKVALSASFFPADPERAIFKGKPLAYLEGALAHWIMSGGAMPVLVPDVRSATHAHPTSVDDYADWLDALVLSGGSDVWPGSYGSVARRPEWEGDRLRDEYEQALFAAFVARGKPVLGVCRGLQLINVALGGTLHQDIPTEIPGASRHRDQESYDRNVHPLALEPDGWLAGVLGTVEGQVNSVHHQAIDQLAPALVVEARCPDDRLIEAVRAPGHRFVVAVQWHPEWRAPGDGTIDPTPLLESFLAAARDSTA